MNDTIVLEKHSTGRLEPKHFYRKLESIFAEVGSSVPAEKYARNFLEKFFSIFHEPLKLQAALLYDCLTTPELVWRCGNDLPDLRFHFPTELPWSGFWEDTLIAILPLGSDLTLRLVFFSSDQTRDENLRRQYSTIFPAVHYALIENRKKLELQDALEQARIIQMSLLPADNPKFYGFDIAAYSIPAKSVGGDLYDFQSPDADSLVITVADAAGHGLAAALQARDVITGLRMGVQPQMDLRTLVTKLNHVISQSGLVSRFVSMVTGRLFRNGEFHYVNAGHPRPLLLHDTWFQELGTGGMILGPRSDAMYESGCALLYPGDALLLYSDGLQEVSRDQEEFGIDRMKQWMRETRDESARNSILELFEKISHFGGRPFTDDITVVLIKRVGAC